MMKLKKGNFEKGQWEEHIYNGVGWVCRGHTIYILRFCEK